MSQQCIHINEKYRKKTYIWWMSICYCYGSMIMIYISSGILLHFFPQTIIYHHTISHPPRPYTLRLKSTYGPGSPPISSPQPLSTLAFFLFYSGSTS